MTKERRLAIKMWEEIVYRLEHDCLEQSVNQFKHKYIEEHGLHWNAACWFCNYIHECEKCPVCIKHWSKCSCATNDDEYSTYSAYSIVINSDVPAERINAAKFILNCHKGIYE